MTERGPRLDEHTARKEYPCDDPDNRGCTRRILKGDRYVQLSYGPGTPPFKAATWVIVRCCSTCHPPATATVLACPIGAGGLTCTLAADHPGPHDYPIGLF